MSTPTRPLKYGENPQQKAIFLLDTHSRDPLGIGKFHTVSGAPVVEEIGDMGWVNLTDLDRGMDALVRIAAAFETNTGAVPHIALLIEQGGYISLERKSNRHLVFRQHGLLVKDVGTDRTGFRRRQDIQQRTTIRKSLLKLNQVL